METSFEYPYPVASGTASGNSGKKLSCFSFPSYPDQCELESLEQEREARRNTALLRSAQLSSLDADQLPLLSPDLQWLENTVRQGGERNGKTRLAFSLKHGTRIGN